MRDGALAGFNRASALTERADVVKSNRDRRYPRKPGQRLSWRYRRETRRAKRLTAHAARIRREALHCWSTMIVRRAADLTIKMPAIKSSTKSPRGNAQNWGGAVEIVSTLNRNTLNQAPALAAAMLLYKAAEAGVRCDPIVDEAPKIAVGAEFVRTAKTIRRLARQIRRVAA